MDTIKNAAGSNQVQDHIACVTVAMTFKKALTIIIDYEYSVI